MPDGASAQVTVLGEAPSAGAQTFGALSRPHAKHIAAGMFWLALSNVLAMAIPSLVNAGVSVVEGSARHTVSMPALLGALVLCALVGAATRVASRVVLFNVGRDVERTLRAELFAHLQTLSPTYFRKSSTGDLMSRLTNDMTNIRLMAGFALLNVLNAVILFCGTLPILFALNARVALWALLPLPIVVGLAQATTRVMFVRTRAQQEALGKLSTAIQENLAGQQVVRAFSREPEERARFATVADDVYRAAMRLATARLALGPVITFFASFGIVIAIYVGGSEIHAGRLDVATLVEMNTRILMLMWPTIAMGFVVSVLQRGRASLVRINEILEIKPDVVDGPHAAAVRGHVQARKLSVDVAPGKPPAIRGLDVDVAPGGFLGVVGQNGSGKSTLLRALARQIPVARGQLSVDGVDVCDWHLKALRGTDAIAVVPEDGFLFSQSLRENLVLGRPDAPADEVERAIDLCDLRRDVNALPDGIETLVGERGVTLSGGQRQRVALARALLSRPRILLLDDCLSAVDAETEANIVSALRSGELFGGVRPTLIVVSHRLSATMSADEILVCHVTADGGEVCERGSHASLLAGGGAYAALWGSEQLKKALTT